MPILNNGETPDRLVVAASPVAAQVRFRAAKDGETRWPEAIPLAPGKPFALAEWREHIWLTGLKRPLKPGDRFPLTLTFAKAGKLDIEVMEIGRASCRERVCQYVLFWVGAVPLKKKIHHDMN